METKVVNALIEGPQAPTLDAQFAWLMQIHRACEASPQPELQGISGPIRDALDLVRAEKDGKADPQFGPKLAVCIYRAHLYVLHSFLEELNKFRNVIAADVAKMKPTNPRRSATQRLQGIFERTIHETAEAYERLRQGNVTAVDEVAAVMKKARDALLSLKDTKK